MAGPGGFWSTLLWQSALFIAIAYVTITTVLFLLQSRMVYYPGLPSRQVVATPKQAGLAEDKPATSSASQCHIPLLIRKSSCPVRLSR